MIEVEAPDLHQERLRYVAALLKGSGVRRVLDLGCGSGGLLQYLVREPSLELIGGLELCGELLAQAKLRLEGSPAVQQGRLELVCGSYTDSHAALAGFDAVAMVETIEHVPPSLLSQVEKVVFAELRPRLLVITTPNHDYNPLYDLFPGEFRDPDHKFEWDRSRFRDWAQGVARRNGYRVRLSGIGEWHPELGQPTQLAQFTMSEARAAV